MQGRNCCLTVRSAKSGTRTACSLWKRPEAPYRPRALSSQQGAPHGPLAGQRMGGCAWPANGAIRSSPYARCWHLCCSPSPGLCTASQASACLPPYPWAGALSATRSCSPTKGSAAPPSFRHPASGGRAKRCISTFCPTIPPWSLCTNPSTARVRFWGCSKRCSPPAWPNGSYRDRWLQEKSLSLPKKTGNTLR